MAQSHDKIQSECFRYLWNQYPQTRRTFWHTQNELAPHKGETKKAHIIRIMQAKAIGVLPGVWDLVWYWKGVLYLFDIKVGDDKLSDEQIAFCVSILRNGGAKLLVMCFEDFKVFVDAVMSRI